MMCKETHFEVAEQHIFYFDWISLQTRIWINRINNTCVEKPPLLALHFSRWITCVFSLELSEKIGFHMMPFEDLDFSPTDSAFCYVRFPEPATEKVDSESFSDQFSNW